MSRRIQLLLCSVLVLTSVLCTALHHPRRSKSKSRSSTTHAKSRSSTTHEHHTHGHHTRQDSTAEPYDALTDDNYTLHFSLWRYQEQCTLGVTDSSVSLWYRNVSELEWTRAESFFIGEHVEHDVSLPYIDKGGMQFRWVQSEHGGGSCNCWMLNNVQLTSSNGTNTIPLSFKSLMNSSVVESFSCLSSITLPSQNLSFCSGSASAPRGVVSRMHNLTAKTVDCIGDESEVLVDPVGHSPISNVTHCSLSQPFIKISFLLHIGEKVSGGNCDKVDSFPEGVEFSGYLYDKWIPLKFYTPESVRNIPQPDVAISDTDVGGDVILLRGYTIPVMYTNGTTRVTEYICGEQFIQDGLQFRFMQTVSRGFTESKRDVWSISSLNVTVHNCSEDCNAYALQFKTTSTSLDPGWMMKGGKIVLSSDACGTSTEDYVLVFGHLFEPPDTGDTTVIISRIVVTPQLDLSSILEGLKCLGIDDEGDMMNSSLLQPSSALHAASPTSLQMSTSATVTSSSTVLSSSGVQSISSSHSLPTSSVVPSTSNSMAIILSLSSTPVPSSSMATPVPLQSTVLPPPGSVLMGLTPVQTPHPSATVEVTASTITTPSFPPFASEEERRIYEIIKADPDLETVYSLIQVGNLDYAVVLLENATFHQPKDSDASVLLLGELQQGVHGRNTTTAFTESFVGAASNIITSENRAESQEPSTTAGSTLLDVLDRYALGTHGPYEPLIITTTNIALVVQTIFPMDVQNEFVVGILQNNHMIQIPRKVLENTNRSQVRIVSYLYQNMSTLLPGSLPDNTNGMRLASPVISSALQCGEEQCDTSSLNLSTPVRIQFRNTPEIQRELEGGASVTCVFWEFDQEPLGTILMTGRWAVRGCERSDDSTADTTICECNHLTHFALLLSPAPPEFSEEETISLEVIGIVGVTVSLVALTITIATFIFLRSLWTMRNYIHVNLCVNLFIAQLIFIVGVEPHGSTASCQAIAVLLHYFFLVTFMWMLMEGVVLYVVLVRVFIKHHKRYIIAFTVISYGLPLLYLGLTVPLGLVLDNGPHYAGDDPEACWLRYDTHFIWAFIAPVILIILANIGFFIMAVTIMYRHQKRQTYQSKTAIVRRWLKASISLLVVMGVTWIIGVLIFHEDLKFIAWIFAIVVGLQGLAIFILFVVLSKQVKEAYWKWWKIKKSESEFLSKHFRERTTIESHSTRRTSLTDKPKSIAMDFSVADRDAITAHLENDLKVKEEKETEPPVYTTVFNVNFVHNPLYTHNGDKANSPLSPEVVNLNGLLDPEKSATVLENDYTSSPELESST